MMRLDRKVSLALTPTMIVVAKYQACYYYSTTVVVVVILVFPHYFSYLKL